MWPFSTHRTFRKAFALSAICAGLLGAIGLSNTVFAAGSPDIVIRDCDNDNGNIPSTVNCGNVYYYSPDIWVRLAPDGGTVHQQPVAGQPAFVYLRLKNRGSGMLGCGAVHVYYTESGVGNASWPLQWINFYAGGLLRGDEIGTACVCCILPGQSTVVMIPWGVVRANVGHEHFCLLARFTSLEDPMQTPEGSVLQPNVVNNNNIAQHNLASTNPGHVLVNIGVQNATFDDAAFDLRFDVNEDLGGGGGGDPWDIAGFEMKVHLDDLYNLWGGQGDGIETKASEKTVTLKNGHARINGIQIGARPCDEPFIYDVPVEFIYPQDAGGDAGKIYYVTMELHKNGEPAATPAINGEAFEITMGNAGGGGGKTIRRPAPDLGMKLDLKAQPNLSKSSTMISYSLPADTRVTLAIYDAHGTIVRSLIADADQTAGGHEIEWDGRSSGGAQVPNGTYFYRLNTPNGAVENQIKIVR